MPRKPRRGVVHSGVAAFGRDDVLHVVRRVIDVSSTAAFFIGHRYTPIVVRRCRCRRRRPLRLPVQLPDLTSPRCPSSDPLSLHSTDGGSVDDRPINA